MNGPKGINGGRGASTRRQARRRRLAYGRRGLRTVERLLYLGLASHSNSVIKLGPLIRFRRCSRRIRAEVGVAGGVTRVRRRTRSPPLPTRFLFRLLESESVIVLISSSSFDLVPPFSARNYFCCLKKKHGEPNESRPSGSRS